MKRRLIGFFIAAIMIITTCIYGSTSVFAAIVISNDWEDQEEYDDEASYDWAEDGTPYIDLGPGPEIINRNGQSCFDVYRAVAGSSNGDVLKLTADIVLAAPILIEWTWEGTLTLDLNGHSIRMYGPDEGISDDDSGTSDDGSGGVFVLSGGTLIVTDSAAYDPYASSGSIYSSNDYRPVFRLKAKDQVPTKLVINSGSISNDYGSYQPLVDLVDVYGNIISAQDAVQQGTNLTVSVSGGSFGQELPNEFIASGYAQVSGDNWWTVQESQTASYQVSFDSMAEGVYSPETQTVQEGYTVVDPGVLIRDGFTFDGWYDLDTNDWYDFSSPVYRDIRLGAWWTQNAPATYTVTFSSQAEGVASPDSQVVEEGYTVNDPGILYRDGYTFDGWYDLASGAWYDFTAPVYSNLNLGAWWTQDAPETFAVSFDSQMYDVAPPQTQYVQAGNTAYAPEGLVCEGYEFIGWYADPDGVTPYYFDDPVYGDITIYAKWERIYKPAYIGSDTYIKGSTEGIIFEIDADYSRFTGIKIDGNYVDPSNYYSWEGSTFVQLIPEYADQLSADIHTVEFDFTDGYCVATFYVQPEEIKTYTVTFSFNGLKTDPYLIVTVQANRRIEIPPSPAGSDGYAFAGWYTDSECNYQFDFNFPIVNDTTLYAKWVPVETHTRYYSVTFYTAHGLIPDGQMVEYGQKVIRPDDPAQTGYVFEGWYSDINYSYLYDFNAPVTDNMTLYAKWSEQPTVIQYYTVNFYSQRGSVPAPQTVQAGHIAAKPADPSADGFVFGGWFTDSNYQYPYDFNTPVNSDITLYARWAELPSQNYIVSFDSNGHGDTPNPQTVRNGQQAARPADPAATGYTFNGWYTDQACTSAYDFRNPVTYNITLYASWKPNVYTVRFDANGGTGTMTSQVYTYGVRAVLPANGFSRSGYYFTGWNTASDGTGQIIADKGEILNLTTQSGATVDLYAQWKNIYSVIEGAGAKIQRGTKDGLTFRVDGDYSKFTGIKVDGNNVASGAYTSWTGSQSTYVQLKAEYINQMTAETHSIRFMFTDGGCETRFDIVSGTPTTGDTNGTIVWIIIAVAALLVIGVTVLLLIRRRRQSADGGYYDDDYDDYDDDDRY